MGINRAVLFLQTKAGDLEAETISEMKCPGVKVTLQDGKQKPEVLVQYNDKKKELEIFLKENTSEDGEFELIKSIPIS